MKHLALAAFLAAAGLIACNKNPAGPTQPEGVLGAGNTTPADSLHNPADSLGECVQEGEHEGECGSQDGDSTETPDGHEDDSTVTPDSADAPEPGA